MRSLRIHARHFRRLGQQLLLKATPLAAVQQAKEQLRDEGVVVIPRHLADEVAADAVEQEKMEAFILERIQGGAPLPGTYPPNEATKVAFDAWRKERGI